LISRIVFTGHRGMQNGTFETSTSKASSAPGKAKARWHAPELKRLDVDLTAGNHRNSNDPAIHQNQYLNS